MRIAVVSSMVRRSGGNGEDHAVLDQIALLREHGHEVMTYLPASDDTAAGATRHARAAVTIASGRGPDPLRELAAFRPDVIHLHNTYPNLGRTWVSRAPAPVVVTLHSFRFMCAAATCYRAGTVCTECLHRPLQAVRHGCYRGHVASLPYAIAGLRRDQDPVLHSATRIIVMNPRMRGFLEQLGINPARVVDGVNTVRASATSAGSAAADGGPIEAGRWLGVGRLEPSKGFANLLQVWPAEVPLDIIGDGPERQRVEAAAPPATRIHGLLPRDAARSAMQRAVGLVVPSRWFEGLPLVYIEALSAGLPVIGFDPSSVAQLVRQDRTGEVADWQAPLEPVLARVADSRENLGDHCKAVFEQRYTPAAYVSHLLSVYERAMAESS